MPHRWDISQVVGVHRLLETGRCSQSMVVLHRKIVIRLLHTHSISNARHHNKYSLSLLQMVESKGEEVNLTYAVYKPSLAEFSPMIPATASSSLSSTMSLSKIPRPPAIGNGVI